MEPFPLPSVNVLGDSSEFLVKQRTEVTVKFLAYGLSTVDTLSNLPLYHNGHQLQSSRYLSVELIRLPTSVNGSTIFDSFVEITFFLSVVKKSNEGEYTLVAENDQGTDNASFSLQVISMSFCLYEGISVSYLVVFTTEPSLKSCSFETDLCDWKQHGTVVGWLRYREQPVNSTESEARSGASGMR